MESFVFIVIQSFRPFLSGALGLPSAPWPQVKESLVPLNSYIELAQPRGPAVVGDRQAGRFLLREIDLCGGPLTPWSRIYDQLYRPAVDCYIVPHRSVGG